MPDQSLHAGDILNVKTGVASNATSAVVSLSGAVTGHGDPGSGTTTSGTTVFIQILSGVQLDTPAGFTQDMVSTGSVGSGDTGWLYVFRKNPAGAAETSWTVSSTGAVSTAFAWAVYEVQRLLGTGYTKSFAPEQNSLNDSPKSTGNSAVVSGTSRFNDCFAFGGFGLRSSNSAGDLASLVMTPNAATTDPYTTLAQVGVAADATHNYVLHAAFGFPFPTASPQWEANHSGVTFTGTGGWANGIAIYPSADSAFADPLAIADGFEYGVTPNTASPTTTTRLLDILNGTWGTQVAVSSVAPRSGTYHMRVTQTGQAGRAGQDTNTLGTSKDEGVIGAGFQIQSSTGVVVLAEIAPAAGTILQLVYDTSVTKLGLRWGSGGTIAYESGTTPTGVYKWVDVVADGFTGTTRTARWEVNQQEEDGPTDLTSQTASSLASITYGLNAAQTVTFDVDDWCLATTAGNWPLGPHNVRLLTVDPAGTFILSGTTTNFNTFSANGTLAAWNATTARDAVDEVPPTISASADGLVQITAAAGDSVTMPMATYALAAGESITYVGPIFALWANSAQTATLDLRGDMFISGGSVNTHASWLATSTAFTPGSTAQPSSLTVPSWVRGKWTRPSNWNQTELDAARLIMGRSSDATPDIGIHVAYLNVAIRESTSTRIYGPDDDGMTVNVVRAGGNGAVVQYQVDVGPTRGATLRYMKAGTEVVEPLDPNDALTLNVDSAYFDHVSRVTVEPDLSGA